MFFDIASYQPAHDDNAQRTPPHYMHPLNLNMSNDDAIDSTMQHYNSVVSQLMSNRRIRVIVTEEGRLDCAENRTLLVLQEAITVELNKLGYMINDNIGIFLKLLFGNCFKIFLINFLITLYCS
jgi:hypothetical protein